MPRTYMTPERLRVGITVPKPSKKRVALNHYSLRRIRELNEQIPIRLALIERCGGRPIERQQTVYHSGTKYIINRVICIDGLCECGCDKHQTCDKVNHRQRGVLEPHEKLRRSQGGKVSLENSIMVLRPCHNCVQGNQIVWSGSKKLYVPAP